MNFYNFTFLNILEYSFVGEKHGIRENLALFERIALRNNPPLNLSLLVRILPLVVLFAIFEGLFIAFLLVVVDLLILLFFFLNGDQLGQFPELILDLLEFP